MTVEEVAKTWADFCSYLLAVEEISAKDIQLAPNPSHDVIQLSLPTEQIIEIEILDIFGRTITSFESNSHSPKINVSSLKGGVYFVRIKTQGNQVLVKKFTKY